MKPMQASENCIKRLAEYEAFRAGPYKDDAGYWTIGFGHKILPDEMSYYLRIAPITVQQAYNILTGDMIPAEKAVNALTPIVPLTQNQYDACVILAFNIGATAFSTSRVVKYIQFGNTSLAADAFLLWDKEHKNGVLVFSPGLHNRRVKERELFLTS